MEKIVYKAPNNPNQHMPDVFIVTEPGMAEKYRAQKNPQGSHFKHHQDMKSDDAAPSSIALVDVVQSFDIFQNMSGKGFEGNVARPAKADLAAIFDTEDQQAIVERIVLHGEIQGAHH